MMQKDNAPLTIDAKPPWLLLLSSRAGMVEKKDAFCFELW